jgi:hypothetical protein
MKICAIAPSLLGLRDNTTLVYEDEDGRDPKIVK